ncbi:MAG TPA: antitoxin VapB family protein [Thermoplasmata archaeon]|nr:antitoxin VapB family protein [Thermoplasmata archaeon]
MPSRNIAVQETVYEALMKEKRPGESFTSVLRRLLDQRGGIEELSGVWGASGTRAARERLRNMRILGRGGRR